MFPYLNQEPKHRGRCCVFVDARIGAQALAILLISLTAVLTVGIIGFDIYQLRSVEQQVVAAAQESNVYIGSGTVDEFRPACDCNAAHQIASESASHDAAMINALAVPDFVAEFMAALFMGVTFLLPNILLLTGVRKKNADYIVAWLFSTFIWIVGMLTLSVISLAYIASGLVIWEFWLICTFIFVFLAGIFSYFWIVVRDVYYSVKRENSADNITMDINPVHKMEESTAHEVVNVGYMEGDQS